MRIFLVALLSIPMFAMGGETGKASALDGIWQGTIGKQAVMACVAQGAGSYFYLRYSQAIPLSLQDEKELVLAEGPKGSPTGFWRMKSVGGDAVDGTWSDKSRVRSAPIRLVRFKRLSAEHSSGCGSYMLDKRVQLQKISVGKVSALSGKRYKKLSASDGNVTSIELLEPGAAIEELNTRLRNELSLNMSEYFACPTEGMGINGKDGAEEKPDFSSEIAPVFWNDRWITFLQNGSGNCGGAHPYSGFSYTTWNLATGELVNPWTWIAHSRKKDASPEYDKYYFNYSAPEELNKIIVAKAVKARLLFNPKEAQEDPNCLDILTENTEYQLSLGTRGLVFSHNFPHVALACDDNIEIPYAKLSAFLTKEGKAAVKSIMESTSKNAGGPR